MMLTVAISMGFVAAAVLAIGSLAQSLKVALPRIATLRQELETCGPVRGYRFTITELVVSHDVGRVIALPVRKPAPRLVPQHGWRAAA